MLYFLVQRVVGDADRSLGKQEYRGCFLEKPNRGVEPGEVVITHGTLHMGFEYPDIGFVVVSGKELLGRTEKQEG